MQTKKQISITGELRKLKSMVLTAAFFTFSFSLIILSSCDKEERAGDEPGRQDDKNEIHFSIGFEPQTADKGNTPKTKATTAPNFTTTWEEGDQIGLFAVSRGSGETKPLASSGNYIHNAKLTYNNGTWTPSQNLYWDGTNVLDFYAYYPYDKAATNPTAIIFNVRTDQSDTTGGKSNHNLSDLLAAKADNSGNGFDRTTYKTALIPLTFMHKLSLMQVEIPASGSWGTGANLIVTLRTVKTGVILNLSATDGTAGSGISLAATGNNPTNITMHRVEQPGNANDETNYTYRALIPAQDIEAGSCLFWFGHEGRQIFQSNKLTTKLEMEAGKVERYEFR